MFFWNGSLVKSRTCYISQNRWYILSLWAFEEWEKVGLGATFAVNGVDWMTCPVSRWKKKHACTAITIKTVF